MSVVDIEDDGDNKWLDATLRLPADKLHDTVLRTAQLGKTSRIEKILHSGMPLGEEILQAAIQYGHTDISDLVLSQKNLDVSKWNEAFNDACAHGGTRGRVTIARVLLAGGVDPRHNNSYALYAALRGHNEVEFIQELLVLGCDPNGYNGVLLHNAIEYQNFDAARVLALYGASPHTRYRMYDAFHHAAESKDPPLQTFLRNLPQPNAEIFINQTLDQLAQVDAVGRSGFLQAALAGHFDVVVDKMAQDGKTPLQLDLTTAITALGRQGKIAQLFDVKIWQGHATDMADFYQNVIPEPLKTQIDLPAITAQLKQHALQGKHKPNLNRFRL